MKDLNLSPLESSYIAHFYVTLNKDIFSIDRANKARSIHENDQRVQGWNPTTIFLKIEHNGAWQTRNLHHTSNIELCAV